MRVTCHFTPWCWIWQQTKDKSINILFICSRNQWRSPTGERVWRNHPTVSARSAGTSTKSKRKVSAKDIQWADLILVMEQKHKQRLQASFNRLLAHKRLTVLDIPDEYQYMDPELITIFKQNVAPLIGADE